MDEPNPPARTTSTPRRPDSVERPGDAGSSGASPQGGPAADEAAAECARRRYHDARMTPVQVGPEVQAMLEPNETVFAARHGVRFDSHELVALDVAPGDAGDVYLTGRRLIFCGAMHLEVCLAEIREVILAGERLYLVTNSRGAIVMETDQPRLLRVEIAALRAAARR